MRVDCHQHFWRYDKQEYDWIDDRMAAIRRDFLPSDLRPLLVEAGFDACVTVQVRQTLEETRWMLDLAEENDWIAGVVGWVDLCSPDVRTQLERFQGRRKLVGVRHIVQAEADERFLLRPDFGRGIALLEQFGLAYDILIYPRHLEVAAEFVRQFPRQRFVLDHLAKPDIRRGEIREWAAGVRALAAAPNVFAKLSGLVTEADWTGWTAAQIRPYLDVAFECFGSERLMIGSDWPVCTVAAVFARAMAVVTGYLEGRPERERAAVLGGNARSFWRLGDKERGR